MPVTLVSISAFKVASVDSPEQIVKILREADKADSAREVIRRYNITEQTFYRWKRVYAGMEVADIKRLTAMDEGVKAELGEFVSRLLVAG